jgi:cell wall integrity and stress response component
VLPFQQFSAEVFTITVMANCPLPSALASLSLAGGSYSWLGCYPSTPLVGAVQLTGTYGSATQCITDCSNAGAGYVYASIAGGSCYCGDSSSSPTTSPGSASSCNLLCSGDNTVCGGYDGSSIYSEVYKYIASGRSSSTSITTSTTKSTSTKTTSSSIGPATTGELTALPLTSNQLTDYC